MSARDFIRHVTLAAAFSVFGRGTYRVLLSASWLVAMLIAFTVSQQIFGGYEPIASAAIDCLAVQWLLTQLCLAGVAWWFGLECRLRNLIPQESEIVGRGKLGIRELLAVTTLAATVFALGRVLAVGMEGNDPMQRTLIFLSFAAVIQLCPLLIAVLIDKSFNGIMQLAFIIFAVAAVIKCPFANQFVRGGPSFIGLILIDIVSAGLTLLTVLVLRFHGLSLRASSHSSPSL